MSDKKAMPDVEAIQKYIYVQEPSLNADYPIALAFLKRLLSTIPSDKSSAEYALWLLSQGCKIRANHWVGQSHVVARSGEIFYCDTGCGPRRYQGFGDVKNLGCHWTIYEEPPPPVDDEELRRKCVKHVCDQIRTIDACVSGESSGTTLGGTHFTPAELARLKELP